MKILKLAATQVHGYLSISVEFFEDLTFLIGLNGSGKTSTLRLLMALLTPNLEELASISFSTADVWVQNGTEEIRVMAQKVDQSLKLEITGIDGSLEIGLGGIAILLEQRRPEEVRTPTIEAYFLHPIVRRIREISNPMFLGLDRRIYAPGVAGDEPGEVRRRLAFTRHMAGDDSMPKGETLTTLAEVNYLVVSRTQEVRANQENLDEWLRAQFFAKAFEYKPGSILPARLKLPSRTEIQLYRRQLSKIEQAAEGLKIPMPQIQLALTEFFERMSGVVDSIDKTVSTKRMNSRPRGSKKPSDLPQSAAEVESLAFEQLHLDWIINKPQADRILEHLALLDDFIEKRNALRDPINRFVSLVNSFLVQTGKTLTQASNGQLRVTLLGSELHRPIGALSSGERQILVMLAHLSLNKSLAGSGIFIVDEPELSLHIDWQEKFVDAVHAANPNVQLILATHSPAIILDRDEACVSLNEASID